MIGLLALVFLNMAGMARAEEGTKYAATPTLKGTRALTTSIWIPEDVDILRGAIVAYDSVFDPSYMALARAHGFALIFLYNYNGDAIKYGDGDTFLNDLAWYADVSGHPEIRNLPFIFFGYSIGGQVSEAFNEWIPERTISFIVNKGAYYRIRVSEPPYLHAAAALKTPAILVSSELDSDIRKANITSLFATNRPNGAPWSLAFEGNTGHNSGNVDGMFFTLFDHAIRARYPAGATPLNGPVTLLDLPETSGWLATQPTPANGLSGKVYPYAEYEGDKTTACWLMDEGVANLYRGFTTYDPAVTVTVVGGPIFDEGTPIKFTVSVDPTLFPDWESVDLYDGADLLGTIRRVDGTNTISAVRPWGGRGVTAIARDAAGNERTSIPKPFVVRYSVALANAPATMAQQTSANLNATFFPVWGSYTVTAYWGTADGGNIAGNWQNSAVVPGNWDGGDATNISYAVDGLSQNTKYYFTFRASNSNNEVWSPTTMSFYMNSVNDAPTSTGGSVNLHGTTVKRFWAGDFPFADLDAGDALGAIKLISLPAQGTLKLNGTSITSVTDPMALITVANIGSLTYTAGAGYPGSDSFMFQVRDASLFSANATMTITGSSTARSQLTAANPSSPTTDYFTNTPATITNSVNGPSLNSLTLDTAAAGNDTWNLNTRTATITTGNLIMTGAGNFTIQNGTLKSNTASALIVNQNGTGSLTLNSVIANGIGNSTLAKAGTGALTLSGENTYSGATTISGGILNLAHALALKNSALNTSNSVVGSATAGLKTDKTTLTLGGLTGDKDLAEVFTTALGGTAGTTALGGYSGVTALTLNPGLGVTNSYEGSISDGTVGMALTKTGAGTQTLSGAHTLTNATVNAGTLGFTGGSLSLANGFVNVGNTTGPSIVKIDGGILDVNSATSGNTGGLQVGHLLNRLGAIYLNSGAITTTTGFNFHIGGVGTNTPSYGFLNITGGKLSGAQYRTRIGQYGGTGVWYMSGGSYSNIYSSATIEVGSVGATDSNFGVVYLNNTARFTSNTAMNIASAGRGNGTLTVAGRAKLKVTGNLTALTAGADSGTTATVNLNGGTLTVDAIRNNATGTFNFNGGTLKAGKAGELFSGPGSAYVYPDGLTIDTNANAVTISQALLAPSGNGVTTIPVTSSGSGYIGAPYVALSGNGTGATAVANMVDDGSGRGTYKVDSITVTCPGRDYTVINSATLSGGLPSGGTAAVLNSAGATFASNAGGGLTKIGSGTLTLTGNNTYTGDTKVRGGVLAVGDSSLADTGRLIIDGGKVNLNNAETVGTLFFGTTQQAAGTYSATGTNGTIASTHFTGTGTLIVTTGPAAGTPTITTSGTLSAMSTTSGTASTPPETFTVAGANMTAGITVTPPPGFEVSQTVGGASGYAGSGTAITVGSSGTIATTTVYVRLAVTASVGTYNSLNIVLSSTGATPINVTTAASGNIVSAPPPVITLTDTLGAVNTTYGTASVTPTSFRVSGSGLTGNLTVTPPTGYEVSLNSGSGYTTSRSIPASGTLADTRVFVRLAATTAVNGGVGYTGNITVSGGGASPKTIATVSSTVAKATPVVIVTPYSVTYDGNPHSATVTSITGVNNETGATVGTVNLNTTHTNAGTYATDSWSLTGTANYNNIASTTLTNTINKATPTATLAVNNSPVTYDGTAKSATVSISSSSVSGAVQSVFTGGAATQTAAGIYEVTANFVPTDTTNYNTLTALAAGNFVIGGTTIPVINGNFETEYGSNTDYTTNWVKLTSWSHENTTTGSVPITGAFSSSADGGSKFTRFTWINSGAEQNLNTNVAVGDTLSVTFNIGRSANAWGGADTTGVVYFKIGSQFYYQDCDVSSHPVGTWKSFTFTTTATNAGALSLGFRGARTTANNQYASVDGVSNVIRISSATPTITTSGTLSTLSTTYGRASDTISFTVSGANMAAGIAVTPPAGFEVSQTAGGTDGYAGSGTAITVGSSGTIATTTVYVRLAATATVGSSPYSGNITCASPGAITQNVATASSTVAKATPTATLAVSNSPVTYDGTAKSATVIINASSVQGGVQNILTGGEATQTAAGSYAVTANFVPNDTLNYNPLNGLAAGNFSIAKATPTATLAVSNSPVTYDGTAKSATVIINASSVQGGVQNILTGGEATQTAAGSYAVTANFVPNDTLNYSTLTGLGAGNFVINPIPTYTVSYNSNGGTGSQADSSSPYNSGTTVTVLGAGTMARTGYAFTGWNTQAGGGGTSYSAGNTFTIANNVTLHAQWTLSTITLADTLGAVNTTYGTASVTPTSFRVSGSGLTGNLTVTPPTGYEVSLNSGSGYTTSRSIPASGTLADTRVFVRLAATTAVNGGVGYTGNITVSGGGASPKTIATVSSTVAKATPVVIVTPYSVTYDGNPHSATVTSITGVNNETGATVGTVNLNTTHTTAGTYASDSWTFTPTANYNSIGTTTSTIAVANGSFETRGIVNNVNSVAWAGIGEPWTHSSGIWGQVRRVDTTLPDNGGGTWVANINDASSTVISQPLGSHSLNAGDTLTATFDVGRTNFGGGVFQALFRVNGVALTPQSYDNTAQTVNTWATRTLTTIIPNAVTDAALTLEFRWVSGRVGNLDRVSNVSRTSDTPQTITNTINRKALSITTPTIAAKNFNGTATAGAVTVGTLSGFVGSETVMATGVAADYPSANAGSYSGTAVNYTLENGTNGGLAANYSLANGTATGVIHKAGSSVTAPTVGTYTYTGLPQGPDSGATANGSTGAVTYSYVGTGGTTYTTSPTKPTNAGSYTVTATVAAAGNYDSASSTATAFSINKATPTVTLAVNNSPTTYDGTAKSATVGISSSAPAGGSVTNISTGGASTQTAAGTYAVTADYVPTDTTNYNTLTALAAGNFVIARSYTSWATANGAGSQTMDQDHDQDGVPNGIEHFLGGNVQTTGYTALPGVNKAADGKLSVTWTKSADFAGAYGTGYVIQTSDSLTGTWDDVPATGGGVTVSGNDVIYTFPSSGPARKFVRLKVMGAP